MVELNILFMSNLTDNKRPDLRSEEVADIIDRMPLGWTHIVVSVITFMIFILVTMGYFIKYPDTVSGQISITGEIAPIRLVTLTSGKLHLLIDNNSSVKKGDYVGYIESGASYSDVMILDSICRKKINSDILFNNIDSLNIGSLSGVYNDFMLHYNKFNRIRNTKIYDNMRLVLESQRNLADTVLTKLKHKHAIYQQIHANMSHQYRGDSALHAYGIISDVEIEHQYNNLLSSEQSKIEYNIIEQNKIAEIISTEIEMAKISMNKEEEFNEAYFNMVAKHNVLINEISRWKENYMLCAPIDGIVEYLGFWRENIVVGTSTELFCISPSKNNYVGEMYMDANGAGKVELGMEVNIKLLDYPYEEYGYIKGYIKQISNQATNVKNQDKTKKAYLVNVEFSEGLVTNYGKRITPNFDAIGTAEIITNKKRLIERLFDNLKSYTEK